MGDILIVFLLQNILLFSLIFWGLTWAGEYFYKKKSHVAKKQFYECGFKAVTDVDIQFNLNFTLLCVFLVLYDVEFVFLMPCFFNLYAINFFSYITLIVFITLIIMSLVYDWQMNALNWQY